MRTLRQDSRRLPAEFVHADGFIAGADNGPSPFGQINNPERQEQGGDTQTGYVLALHMNLLPDALRAAAAKDWPTRSKPTTVCWHRLSGHALSAGRAMDTGHSDLAYRLLLNTRVSFLGLYGRPRRHHHVGALERRPDARRPQHELLQPLRLWRGGRLDLPLRRRHGCPAADAGFHTIVLHPIFDARLGSLDFRYESSYGEIRPRGQ